MKTSEEKLKELTDDSVWVFTKQDTNFDEAFKAAKLFAEIPNKESVNIEDYFTRHHARYGINTDRHRILVIPQFYGLITKTPFFERGSQYNNENPTAVFEALNACEFQGKQYNQIKSEQLLKLKIRAIIDTADNNKDWHVLPLVFSFSVLRKLKEKYGITRISKDAFFTYVMTCKSFEEVDEAVEFIAQKAPITKHIARYKDRSRVLTSFLNNCNLFIADSSDIALNPAFDDYFHNNFISKYDLDDLHTQLLRDVDYSYFLYNIQNFNINIIDAPTVAQNITKVSTQEKIVVSPVIEDDDESEYVAKVDDIKESNINEDVANEAHRIAPITIDGVQVGRRFITNPLLGKIAIKKAYYCCEKDVDHKTFKSKKTNKDYMEAHHLVPICFQQLIWDKYKINIDYVENIVSLCPTCHKAFHYGTKEVQSFMIEDLFKKCAAKYKSIGFKITLEEIKHLYSIATQKKES